VGIETEVVVDMVEEAAPGHLQPVVASREAEVAHLPGAALVDDVLDLTPENADKSFLSKHPARLLSDPTRCNLTGMKMLRCKSITLLPTYDSTFS